MKIIKTRINLDNLKIEIYYANKKNELSLDFPITHEFMTETYRFDQYFRSILKICRKYSKEVEHDKEELVWYVVFDTLYDLKYHEKVANKRFCRNFFQQRINIFIDALLRVVPFKNFVNHVLEKEKNINFGELQDVILKLFQNTHGEEIVLMNANNAIFKVNSELFSVF